MSDLKIAVVVGSTRPGRNGKAVADWVLAQAQQRGTATYELVDLLDHSLPHLDEPLPAAAGRYQNDHTKRWAATIAPYDGFVFVTPEYNHSVPGVLKNAIDYLFAEWTDKAAALVGYGSVGGARSIEHLRGILSQLQVAHVGQTLTFSLATDFENLSQFTPAGYHLASATTMLDQLESWTGALKRVRTA
ncbi:MAG: NAD(P)H-dependent oxidoreductase [Micrococcales bacterium]|nr:NAD(P)H-dependent oxidoreductase [Micrococcales bacterium]